MTSCHKTVEMSWLWWQYPHQAATATGTRTAEGAGSSSWGQRSHLATCPHAADRHCKLQMQLTQRRGWAGGVAGGEDL